jgi:hypothetical protein
VDRPGTIERRARRGDGRRGGGTGPPHPGRRAPGGAAQRHGDACGRGQPRGSTGEPRPDLLRGRQRRAHLGCPPGR